MDARDIVNLQEAYLQVYSEPELTEEALIAAEYFYEQGLNEDGVNQLIEDLGVDEFVDWIGEIVESYELTEARRSGRIDPVTKSGKSIGSLKGGAKSAAISRLRKEKAARRESEASSDRSSGMKAALRSQAMTAAASKQKPSVPQKQAPAKAKAGIGAAIGGALKWAKEKGAKDLQQTRQGLQTLGQTWQGISDTKAAQAARIGLKKGSRAIEKHGHTVGSAAGKAAGQFVRSLRKEEFEEWVDSLVEEGYDLSDYTWDDMYEIYEANVVMSVTSPSGKERSVSRIRSGQETPEQIRNRRFSQALADREKERKSKMNAGRLTVATKRGIERATNRSERGENDWVNVPLNPPKAKPSKSLKGSERQKAFRDIRQKMVDTELKDPKKVKQFRRRHGLPEEFELILSHLLDEGYAETLESAEAILESMSEEWVFEILDEAKYGTKAGRHKLAMRIRKGEDVGKKGPGFKKVAAKAAKKYGSKERGEKVAAAAMWSHLGK